MAGQEIRGEVARFSFFSFASLGIMKSSSVVYISGVVLAAHRQSYNVYNAKNSNISTKFQHDIEHNGLPMSVIEGTFRFYRKSAFDLHFAS